MPMEVLALSMSPVPVALELMLATLLWAAGVALGLSAMRLPLAAGPAGRARAVSVAAAIGLGHWVALLCAMTALTGASGARVEPRSLLASMLLAMAAATLPLRVHTGRWAELAAPVTAGSVIAMFCSAALLGLALRGQWPSITVLVAVAISVAAAQVLLAWTTRVLVSAAEAASPRAVAGYGVAVTLAWALPVFALALVVPAAVGESGSTGAPWLLALCAVVAMAVAGAQLRAAPAAAAPAMRRSRRARAEAEVDALTGLPGRDGLNAWLAAQASDGQDRRVALLVIGLDGFKKINDAFGMRSGDAALAEAGRRLAGACATLPSGAPFVAGPVARTGGDEFTLALHGDVGPEAVTRVAARVLELLAKPLAVEDTALALTASIGIACAPDDGTGTTLAAHADAALRAAKQQGGGSAVRFEARLMDEARDRLDLLRDLRRAVDERQLELHYQPKIDAKSGQVTAAEALLRWSHPTRGQIGPGVFIPLAERYGLIGALGNWVIDDACRQARLWRKAGLKMRVAINLSAAQMRQDDLIDRILEALARNGIDPSRLTCEITETVAMEDTQTTQRTFDLLGEAGIHLSIDDFGTGYSSLAYLRSLPAAELKIDRAFVKDLGASDDARAIVDAVVQMAHAIGLRVVAEGVETLQQRDALMELGCDELQGFLFAKPMSARALLLWAVQDRRDQQAFRPSLFADTDTPTLIHPGAMTEIGGKDMRAL